jgi:YfiH family protein
MNIAKFLSLMEYLVKDKVYYKIFDRSFVESSQFYSYDSAIDIDEIDNNRKIIKNYLNVEFLYTLKQVHSCDIVVIKNLQDSVDSIENEGDAIITDLNSVAIAVKTADCVPLLLSSSCGSLIAAIHCSSKSTRADIISKTIEEMYRIKDIKSLKAVIGPSIKKDSYEVGEDFYKEFLEESKLNNVFFTKKNDQKYLFDLPSYVRDKLKKYDVEIDLVSEEDTYSNPSKYPSHRYSSKKGEKYSGAILSTICKSL